MADITGGAVPGMDVKSILRQMQGAPEAFAAEVKPYQDQLAASTTKIEEMRKKQAAERAPIVGQIKAKSAEPGPEYKPGELPDFKPPQIDPKEMNDTMSLLTAVAAMSGLLTRQPLTAALNAFSQGVHGYVQGNQEAYKRSLDTFKTSFEKAKTTNDEHYRQVQQAQAKHKNDIQGLMNELTVLSAEHQDAVQSEMLRRGDLTSAINLVEKRHQSMDKMMTNVARILETQAQHAETARHHRAVEQRLSSGGASSAGSVDPKMVKMLADRYRTGDTAALTGLGYGKEAQALRRAVLTQAAQDADKEGQTGSDLAGAKAGYQADSASLRQYQNYVNRLEALGGKIDKDIDTLFTVAEKGVGPTKLPVFDKWVQKGRKALGDPDVAAFETQIQTVKNEYGRAMSGPASNAQLTVSAMKHADDLINSAQNLEQLEAVVQVMRQDIKNQSEVAAGQIGEIKGRLSGGKKRRSDDVKEFKSEADAEAAGLSPGEKVIINGVKGTWH